MPPRLSHSRGSGQTAPARQLNPANQAAVEDSRLPAQERVTPAAASKPGRKQPQRKRTFRNFGGRRRERDSVRRGERPSAPNAENYGHATAPQTADAAESAANPIVRSLSAAERKDMQLVWGNEENKRHQLSLRMVAVLAFAALAVLIVITPLRGYIAQQEQIRALHSELESSEAHIEQLKESIALWQDPEYVRAQARERLGYVMPGQTLYFVTGGEADPEKAAAQRVQEANDARRAITPFYVTLWDSISVAGQSGTLENPQNVPVIGGDSTDTDKPGSDAGQPSPDAPRKGDGK